MLGPVLIIPRTRYFLRERSGKYSEQTFNQTSSYEAINLLFNQMQSQRAFHKIFLPVIMVDLALLSIMSCPTYADHEGFM